MTALADSRRMEGVIPVLVVRQDGGFLGIQDRAEISSLLLAPKSCLTTAARRPQRRCARIAMNMPHRIQEDCEFVDLNRTKNQGIEQRRLSLLPRGIRLGEVSFHPPMTRRWIE
jgi:hypothetical protein